MRAITIYVFLFLPCALRAQQLDNYASAKGLTITGPVTCYIDSTQCTWQAFLDKLYNNPRPYIFSLQTDLRNNSDTALDLFLVCGRLDYIDAWLQPANASSKDSPAGSANAAAQHTSGGALRAPPPTSTYLGRRSLALPLHLAPHRSAHLLIRIRQPTDDYVFNGFALYDTTSLSASFVDTLAEDNANLIIQMLFMGVLFCQLLYALFQWLIIRRPEYRYYLLYMALIAGYFLSKQETLFGTPILFDRWPLLKIYLGKTLLILPYFVYFRFVRSFLDIPRDHPRLNRWVVAVERFLLAYSIFDFLFILLTFNRRAQTTIYTIIFSVVFLLSVAFLIYLIRYRRPLYYFIIAGSLIVGTGHILGLIFSYLEVTRHLDLGIPDIMVFPQAGILLEIFCFTAGLSYKNSKTEKEKLAGQEKLIEQLQANELLQTRMQHIRNKIAQDLHDDIGSTLSSISILSDLAIRGNSNSQAMETMTEILDSSLMLMERMDDIVWSINPRNDSLENLLMRVRHFATTLFEAKGVEYTIDIQKNIHEVRLPMDYRQHIYLILKEAINNLVKYARATEAVIEVRFDHRHLVLSVCDNGCGFDPETPTTRNGIAGIYQRAAIMNAHVGIVSAPGRGTAIRLEVSLS